MAKLNKDGFEPGVMVDHKAHNKWLIAKRQAEKKAKAAALAAPVEDVKK